MYIEAIRKAFWGAMMVLVMVMCFTSCSADGQEYERFELKQIQKFNDCMVYVMTDKETNRQYLFMERSHGMALTPLLSAEEEDVVEPVEEEPEPAATMEEDIVQYAAPDEELDEPDRRYLGEFTITHYCACEICCGKAEGEPGYGITATGTKVEEGRTVAVDPNVIPFGSEVIVYYDDGSMATYIAEDSGSAIKGNRLDVYMDSHQEALVAGVKSGSVSMVVE